MEKRNGNSAGPRVGTDGRADGADGKVVSFAFPESTAVLNVFLQKGIVQTAVAKAVWHGEVDTAVLLYILDKHIVSVFGASCFSEDGNFSL